MKTFYKVTLTHKLSTAGSVYYVFLIRDCFSKKKVDDIIKYYKSQVDKTWKTDTSVKIKKKSYKRVPNKYGVI